MSFLNEHLGRCEHYLRLRKMTTQGEEKKEATFQRKRKRGEARKSQSKEK